MATRLKMATAFLSGMCAKQSRRGGGTAARPASAPSWPRPAAAPTHLWGSLHGRGEEPQWLRALNAKWQACCAPGLRKSRTAPDGAHPRAAAGSRLAAGRPVPCREEGSQPCCVRLQREESGEGGVEAGTTTGRRQAAAAEAGCLRSAAPSRAQQEHFPGAQSWSSGRPAKRDTPRASAAATSAGPPTGPGTCPATITYNCRSDWGNGRWSRGDAWEGAKRDLARGGLLVLLLGRDLQLLRTAGAAPPG